MARSLVLAAAMAAHSAAATLAGMSKRPATYADLEALPSNQVGEILGGVLHAFPRPAIPHTAAASAFGMELALELGALWAR